MELFLFLVLVIILFVYLSRKFSNLSDQNSALTKKADKLENELGNIKELIKRQIYFQDKPESWRYTKADVAPTPVEEKPTPSVEEVKPTLVAEESKNEEVHEPIIREEVRQEVADVVEEHDYVPPSEPSQKAPTVPKRKVLTPEPSFFDNLDWEKFIGENLINKIGIGILVLGIGFFVKYAIDKDWINEIGRVFIGILCGGALVGFAHRLRKEYSAFSSVLIGGGLSVFYFSIAIAFHEYQLIGQTAAFLIMVLITAFAILLSITYNRQELAVLAIIGGFTTPFMVSTGEGNYIVLFSYLLILNTGMLVLAYFRKWNIVNIVSYVFTIILYTGWFSTKVVGTANAPYTGALVFATLFYLEFFLMNIINNLKERQSFIALDFTIILSNTFAYYSVGMIILEQMNSEVYQGLFTVLLAAFNFLFAFSLFKSGRIDKNLVYLLIGLVVTFISLAGPVQLEGNWITMFWALEGVLLLWLAQKSGISLLKLSSVLVTALMIISLTMDWFQLYFSYNEGKTLTVLLNKAFITGILALVSLYMIRRLLRDEKEDFFTKEIPVSAYRTFIVGLLILGSYVVFLLELNYQLDVYINLSTARSIYLGIYHFIWLGGLAYILRKYRNVVPEFALPCLAAFSALLYMFYYHQLTVSIRILYLVDGSTNLVPFFSHYLIALLFIGIVVVAMKDIHNRAGFKSTFGSISLWFMAGIVLFISSSELDHLLVLCFYTEPSSIEQLVADSRRIGYPILWGISSFAFMWFGIKKKIRQLRIVSLSVFFIILLKLFLIDVSKMPEGGKIIAFIVLGIILLVISFLYQKLKKLIIEDETQEEGPIETPLSQD